MVPARGLLATNTQEAPLWAVPTPHPLPWSTRWGRTARPGLPAQLGPVLELVPLRFCGVLPWRLETPQLRL